MARFVDYSKNTDYTAWQTANPGQPHSGANLDSDYDEISTVIAGINVNAQLVQREDGKPANNTIHPDSLTAATLSLMGGSWAPRGRWATSTAYLVGDVVETSDGNSYVAAVAHTSGTFTTDQAAGYWVIIAGATSLYAQATGTGDSMVALLPQLASPVTDASQIRIRAVGANTGAAVININGTGDADVTVYGDQVLQPGAIRAVDHDLELRYNLANSSWELLNPHHHLDQVVPVADKINYYDGAAANAQLPVATYGKTAIAWETVSEARTSLGVAAAGAQHSLTELLNPVASAGWSDIYRSGWQPAWLNQQWGGAEWGNMPDGSLGEVAAWSAARPSAGIGVANAAANTYVAQGFQVGSSRDVSSVLVHILKVGNPTGDLGLYIYSDSAGDPDAVITNGTATAQTGELHNPSYEWVRFVFPTAPSITSDTQYHVVLKSSAAADGANYWVWNSDSVGAYPYGNYSNADGTPTWSQTAGTDLSFMVETAAADRMLRSGGQFDGLLEMNAGTPLNLSRGLTKPLSHFLSGGVGTLLVRGEDYTKDSTIADLTMGALDHDRIVLRCNVTTGYAQVDIHETDGTVQTVAGTTTDLSDGSFHDVAVRWRTRADGADYLSIYIDGAEEGAPIGSATITMSDSLEKDGVCWLGAGFPAAVTWDEDEDMSALPSAGNWTWTGTGTEASCMVVSGGQLFQNGAGYGAAHNGYYAATTTLDNATGWVVATKLQVKADQDGGTADAEISIDILDGAKTMRMFFHKHFITMYDGSVVGYIQQDMTDAAREITVVGKLSDIYVFIDGRLAFDGTGLFDAATGTNAIYFGDRSTGAGVNGSAVWDYVKYYDAAWVTPEHCGGKISQVAHWAADQTTLLADLWNTGSPQSVKVLAGVKENYIAAVSSEVVTAGMAAAVTTTSTTSTQIDDIGQFVCVGREARTTLTASVSNSSAGDWVAIAAEVAGAFKSRESLATSTTGGHIVNLVAKNSYRGVGMVLLQPVWRVSAGTGSFPLTLARSLTTVKE